MNAKAEVTGKAQPAQTAAAILAALIVPLGLYLLAALVAAGADGRPLLEVACFEPARVDELSLGRAAAAVVMALAAVAFLFVVPGLLGTLAFMRLSRTRRTAYAWSLAANSAALITLCLLLRETWGVHRLSFCAAWLGWTVVLFALAWQPGQTGAILGRLRRRYGSGLLIGLLTAVVAITLFFPEQFIQCFSEDGTETYELARSLREYFLPYWELETWDPLPGGRMGTVVVNPSLVNSYWTCGLQTLLGDGELATRLPYWVWYLGVFAVAYRLMRPGTGAVAWLAAAVLGLTVFLGTLLFTFYAGYNPYMADLANPGVPDALFTLLVLAAFDCLRQRDRWGWAVSMILASLVLYAGGVLLVLMLISAWCWRPIERKEAFGWAVCGLGLLLAVVAFYVLYGWLDGSLPFWVETVDIEYVQDYLAAVPRWKSGPLFLGYFLLGCGVIPAVGLVLAFGRGPWQRTVATTAVLYLLIVLASGFKNLHWLGPLMPLPLILFLMGGDEQQQIGQWRHLLSACCLVICIAICWPAKREAFTLNRQLGMNTTIASDYYLTAAQWARLRYTLREQGVMSWDCDQHTWVAYAELDPTLENPRPLVLTPGGPPTPAYRQVGPRRVEATNPGPKLYARGEKWEEWLSGQRPLRPLERYPAVFAPLAEGLYSPHNNPLEDVRRLRWP